MVEQGAHPGWAIVTSAQLLELFFFSVFIQHQNHPVGQGQKPRVLLNPFPLFTF